MEAKFQTGIKNETWKLFSQGFWKYSSQCVGNSIKEYAETIIFCNFRGNSKDP